tara:strand:+ start:310 stop:618 length:309 start_codon:yes stop_codon:yes gene_type:complete
VKAINRMTDPGFLAFLGSRRLTSITGDSPYAVGSQSGQSYGVDLTWHTDSYSGALHSIWHCSCPASGGCRHIDAVVDMRWAEASAADDYDGMDVMEREQVQV